MIARLTVHLPRQPTKTLVADRPGEYTIGRDPSCELVLEDARVSRRHASLVAADERWRLVDLGSKNGVSVEGERVRETEVGEACWISFGGLIARFEPLEAGSTWALERSRRWQSSLDAHQAMARSGQGAAELVERLIASVLDITRAERGFVVMPAAGGRLRVVGSSGAGADVGTEFSGSGSTVRRVLDGAGAVAESDVIDDAVLAGQPSVVEGGIRGLVCLPLEAGGERLGVLYADSSKPGAAFDELDLEIVEALASHAALALRVEGMRRELEGLAGSLPTAFVAPGDEERADG